MWHTTPDMAAVGGNNKRNITTSKIDGYLLVQYHEYKKETQL